MVRTLNDAYLDLRQELKRAGISGYQLEGPGIGLYGFERGTGTV